MDFFEAQDQARSKTKTLVALFIAAVLAMGSLIYFGVSYALINQVNRTLPLWSLERFVITLGSVTFFVGICSLWKIGSLKEGGSSIALMLGGSKVPSKIEDPKWSQYRNVVEEMSIASGIRIPEIYVLKDELGINAFAAGYTPDNAVVAVSQGCLDQLDRDELQGVVAHEFSHILNGDMRINSRLIGVIFGLLAITVIGRIVLRSVGFRSGRRSSKEGGGGVVVAVIAIAAIVMIVGYIGVFFGKLIQSAISRQREYLADSSAVQFTRNPGGIANALRKIKLLAGGSRIQHPDAMEASHIFFSNALSKSFASAFSTHPPLDDRIAAIDPRGTTKKKLSAKPTDPSSKRSRQPSNLVSNLGSLDHDSIPAANRAFDSLPESLVHQARNPATAYTVLLASMNAGSPTPEIQSLGPAQKHALFEVALAAIKELPPPQLSAELANFRQHAQADGVIDFDEQCLLTAIERSIQTYHTNAKFGHRTFPKTRQSIEIVLSAIALSGADNDAEASKAFRKGATAFNAFGTVLHPRFDHARNPGSLNAAIIQTSESIMKARKTTLLAAASIVAHDDELSDQELQHIRSLCAALDCPMPGLSAG